MTALTASNQVQKVRRQAGILGGGIVERFQPLGGVALVHLPDSQHNGHPGLAAPAKRHQHHAAGKDPPGQLRGDAVGVQLVKVDVRVVDGSLGQQQAHSSLPCCSLNWMME